MLTKVYVEERVICDVLTGAFDYIDYALTSGEGA